MGVKTIVGCAYLATWRHIKWWSFLHFRSTCINSTVLLHLSIPPSGNNRVAASLRIFDCAVASMDVGGSRGERPTILSPVWKSMLFPLLWWDHRNACCTGKQMMVVPSRSQPIFLFFVAERFTFSNVPVCFPPLEPHSRWDHKPSLALLFILCTPIVGNNMAPPSIPAAYQPC